MHEVSPRSPLFRLSGRWTAPSSGSAIIAFWSGSSVSFLFQGSSLQLRTGPSTVRKDRFNGGTPMIACAVESTSNSSISTYDAQGTDIITLIDEGFLSSHGAGPYAVHITLIDWASVFEIEAFLVSSDRDIISVPPTRPSLNVLVIGDSISCGWTDVLQSIPLGCLNALPFVLRRNVLQNEGIDIRVDLIAYPGMTLVDPTEDELNEGAMLGMVSKFFHTSPWNTEIAEALDKSDAPEILLIALGTNDEAQDVSPVRFMEALRTLLVKLLRLYDQKVRHICLIPPFSDIDASDSDEDSENITQSFSSIVDALRQEPDLMAAGVVLHEIRLGAELQHDHLLDGLHPNVAGYELLGAALSERMAPLLQSCVTEPT
ncbi:hypothetical protein VKT23_004457 [Stygiomarasmius scandens]|uniref:SGNH hydrolase-type esterase domain-containing protein n=1 Tax=Marasmiellus scandens TaxID=2682957 RepID=A0ABR1K0K8_9AGAR